MRVTIEAEPEEIETKGPQAISEILSFFPCCEALEPVAKALKAPKPAPKLTSPALQRLAEQVSREYLKHMNAALREIEELDSPSIKKSLCVLDPRLEKAIQAAGYTDGVFWIDLEPNIGSKWYDFLKKSGERPGHKYLFRYQKPDGSWGYVYLVPGGRKNTQNLSNIPLNSTLETPQGRGHWRVREINGTKFLVRDSDNKRIPFTPENLQRLFEPSRSRPSAVEPKERKPSLAHELISHGCPPDLAEKYSKWSDAFDAVDYSDIDSLVRLGDAYAFSESDPMLPLMKALAARELAKVKDLSIGNLQKLMDGYLKKLSREFHMTNFDTSIHKELARGPDSLVALSAYRSIKHLLGHTQPVALEHEDGLTGPDADWFETVLNYMRAKPHLRAENIRPEDLVAPEDPGDLKLAKNILDGTIQIELRPIRASEEDGIWTATNDAPVAVNVPISEIPKMKRADLKRKYDLYQSIHENNVRILREGVEKTAERLLGEDFKPGTTEQWGARIADKIDHTPSDFLAAAMSDIKNVVIDQEVLKWSVQRMNNILDHDLSKEILPQSGDAETHLIQLNRLLNRLLSRLGSTSKLAKFIGGEIVRAINIRGLGYAFYRVQTPRESLEKLLSHADAVGVEALKANVPVVSGESDKVAMGNYRAAFSRGEPMSVLASFLHKDLLVKTAVHIGVTERSFCRLDNNIGMGSEDGFHSRALAHEYCHAVERGCTPLLALCRTFVTKRGKGEKITSLREITGIPNWPEDEMAYPDEWKGRGGSAYTGRWYRSPATEILPTGIERLTNDPADFFREDPEHAFFTVACLSVEFESLVGEDGLKGIVPSRYKETSRLEMQKNA